MKRDRLAYAVTLLLCVVAVSEGAPPIDCQTPGFKGNFSITPPSLVLQIDVAQYYPASFNCSFQVFTSGNSILVDDTQDSGLRDYSSDRIEFACADATTPFFTVRRPFSNTLPSSITCATVNVTVMLGAGPRASDELQVTLKDSGNPATYICPNNSVTTLSITGVAPGAFLRPNLPLNSPNLIPYPPNWNCTFIVRPANAVDRVQAYYTEYPDMMPGDSLVIADDAGAFSMEVNRPLLTFGVYPVAIASNASLRVSFRTGPTNRYRTGFGLSFDVISNPAPRFCSSIPQTIDASTLPAGQISNLDAADLNDYGIAAFQRARYPSPRTCTWTITAPMGQLIQIFNPLVWTEQEEDYVYLYDGAIDDSVLIAKLSGMPAFNGTTWTSKGQVLIIQFVTSSASRAIVPSTNYGFVLQYSTVPGSTHPTRPFPSLPLGKCLPVTLMELGVEGGFGVGDLISGATPGYLPNQDCLWRIPVPENFALQLSFSFSLLAPQAPDTTPLADGDSVVVYASDNINDSPSFNTYVQRVSRGVGYTTNDRHAPVVLTVGGAVVWVRFRSDGVRDYDGAGFEASYGVVPYPRCRLINNPIALPVTGLPPANPRIMSYPPNAAPIEAKLLMPYASNMDCTWVIDPGVPVALTLKTVDMVAGDSFKVYAGANISGELVYDSEESQVHYGLVPPISKPEPTPCLRDPATIYFREGPVTIRFVSDDSPLLLNGGGFAFSWTTYMPAEPCVSGVTQDFLFVQGAGLRFPSNMGIRGNKPYILDHDVDCTWLVTLPPGNLVSAFLFNNFYLMPGDGLSIYEGDTIDSAAQLYEYRTDLIRFEQYLTTIVWDLTNGALYLPKTNVFTVRFTGFARSCAFNQSLAHVGVELQIQSYLNYTAAQILAGGVVDNPACNRPPNDLTLDASNPDVPDILGCTVLVYNSITFGDDFCGNITFPNLRYFIGTMKLYGQSSYNILPTHNASYLDMPQLIQVDGLIICTSSGLGNFDAARFSNGVIQAPKLRFIDLLLLNVGVLTGNASTASTLYLPALERIGRLTISPYDGVGGLTAIRLPSLTAAGFFKIETVHLARFEAPNLRLLLKNLTLATGSDENCFYYTPLTGDASISFNLDLPVLEYVGGPIVTTVAGDHYAFPRLKAIAKLYVKSPVRNIDISSVKYAFLSGDAVGGGSIPIVAQNINMSSLQYAGNIDLEGGNDEILSEIVAPMLKMMNVIFLRNMLFVTRIYTPQLRATEFSLDTVKLLSNVVAPSLRFVTVASSYNVVLQPLAFPSAITATVILTSGNNKLRGFDFPSLNYLEGGSSLQSLDLAYFNAPQLVTMDSVTITQSRMLNLSFTLLEQIESFSIDSSINFRTLAFPRLKSVFDALSLSNTGILSVTFPSLTVMNGTLSIESNHDLFSIYACNLVGITGSVIVRASPQLSCRETETMFASAVGGVIAGEADCSSTLVGTFGCQSNYTVVVNTSLCGFTVACIQRSIAASYTDSNIVIVVPAGTYRNCSSPLSFLGRSLVLRGAGMGATVIDCEGLGTGFLANQNERFDTVLTDMSFINGRASAGGAFTMNGGSPTFVHVAFGNNRASDVGGAGVVASAHPQFYHCVFFNNSAVVGGGGVQVQDNAAPSFTNCTFSANVAGDYGGGLAFVSAAASVLTTCHVTTNSALRGGGIYADGPLLLDHTIIESNDASEYGGGLAAVPIEPTGIVFTLLDSTIIDNAANEGGGIFGYSATLALVNTLIQANSATETGGAMSVGCSVTYRTLIGLTCPCATFVNATGGSIVGNKAGTGNGGGIYAENIQLYFNSALLSGNSAGGDGGAVYTSASDLTFTNATTISSNSGTRGGGVYCSAAAYCSLGDAVINANHAVSAGGGVFWCRSGCLEEGQSPYPLSLTSVVFSGNVADGYGQDRATDPTEISWRTPPQLDVVTGFALSGDPDQSLRVLIQDDYGQTVAASIDVLQLSVVPITPGGAAVLVGTLTVLATDGNAIFAGTRVMASSPNGLGLSYAVVCQHTSLLGVQVTSNFTLSPCQLGMGLAAAGSEALEGAPVGAVVCEYCGAGSYSSDGLCVDCSAGSFSAAAGSTQCTPCGVDMYQPAVKSTLCIPCPENSHASGGATECTRVDATSNNTAAIAGSVSAVLIVLIAGIIIAAICIVRYSKKKTMERYYLEEDATVRRGVKDSSLALAVRKFIGASTTTRIGGGEFTDVYKGRHEGQWIALKAVKGDAVGQSVALTEFRREVVALSILNEFKHPAIVELKFFLERSPVCIGLSFYANGSLKRSLATLHLSVGDKVKMAAQVASALAVLHGADIAHCDIKTDNILLTNDNDVKLADFGICQVLGDSRTRLATAPVKSATTAGALKDEVAAGAAAAKGASLAVLSVETVVDTEGRTTTRSVFDQNDRNAFTPQYVDPQRLRHDADTSDEALRRADIYSFGMVMWAIYKQEEPFAGIDPTTLADQRRDRPDMRPGAVADCHPCYERVMLQASATEPLARLTAAGCLEALRTCLRTDFGGDLPEAYLRIPSPSEVAASSAFSSRSGPPTPMESQKPTAPSQFDSRLATAYGNASSTGTAPSPTLNTMRNSAMESSGGTAGGNNNPPPGGSEFLQTVREPTTRMDTSLLQTAK